MANEHNQLAKEVVERLLVPYAQAQPAWEMVANTLTGDDEKPLLTWLIKNPGETGNLTLTLAQKLASDSALAADLQAKLATIKPIAAPTAPPASGSATASGGSVATAGGITAGDIVGNKGPVTLGGISTAEIHHIQHGTSQQREQLSAEVETLNAELAAARAQATSELEKQSLDVVEEQANQALDELKKEQPNPVKLQITLEGLKKAAENIASVVPSVMRIAGMITGLIPLA